MTEALSDDMTPEPDPFGQPGGNVIKVNFGKPVLVTPVAPPLPHTPTLPMQTLLAAGRWGRTVLRGPELAAYWTTRTVLRRPGTSGALTLAAVTATPVTWSHVTGGVIATCATLGVGAVGCSTSRARVLSLHDHAKAARQIRRIKRRWVTVCSDVGLAKQGTTTGTKRVPRITGATTTNVGVRLRVRGGSIASPENIAKKGDQIRAAYGARGIDIRPDPDRPSITLMDIVTRDPFARVIKVADLPAPTRGGLSVAVGIDSWGGPVERDPRLPCLLVGGKGSGKSSEVWVTIERLLTLGIPFRLRVFDPKGGVEFSDLAPYAYQYENDATKWASFLEDLLGGMNVRGELMAKRGIRKLSAEHFTEAEPFDLTIIDELLTVIAFSDPKIKIRYRDGRVKLDDALTKIFLSQCRAFGYGMVACTQLSQKSAAGDARDMFDNTTVLRVPSDDIVRAVGFDPAICPAHMIPALEKFSGIGYTMTEQGPVKYRAAYLNDRERADVARRVGQMTERIGGPKR
jgi:hypothetical protein